MAWIWLFWVVLVTVGTVVFVRAKLGRPKDSIMAFLGSGGHTGEMLLILRSLNFTKGLPAPIFVYSHGDSLSVSRARQLKIGTSAEFLSVPRARSVGQGWISTVFTSARALLASFRLILSCNPNVLLCNGPGTCVMLVMAVVVLKSFGARTRIIYVESLARVNDLSLSGKINYYFVDRFFVQWPELQKKYPRAEYLGLLV